MPFDDENIKEPVRKIGLKQSNTNTVLSPSKRDSFEKKADEQFSKTEEYKQQIWDLSIKYKSFIENRTLAENRGPIASSLEKEVIDKLIQLATTINEDDTQQEAMGTTALCMLLLKSLLIQRDIINNLSFKVDKLLSRQPIEK